MLTTLAIGEPSSRGKCELTHIHTSTHAHSCGDSSRTQIHMLRSLHLVTTTCVTTSARTEVVTTWFVLHGLCCLPPVVSVVLHRTDFKGRNVRVTFTLCSSDSAAPLRRSNMSDMSRDRVRESVTTARWAKFRVRVKISHQS